MFSAKLVMGDTVATTLILPSSADAPAPSASAASSEQPDNAKAARVIAAAANSRQAEGR